MATEVLTIGHSTLAAERFVSLLAAREVAVLADVRRYPASRRNPHFNADALAATLRAAGIDYESLAESLGGRRRARQGSPNRGWRVEGFSAYADYMRTQEFDTGIDRLTAIANERRAAVMCAEADWRRCHRRLISDALTIRSRQVVHVRDGRDDELHLLTPFAVVEEGRLTYPPPQGRLEV